MLNQVFAEGIRVSDEVAKCSSCIGSRFFFRVLQQLNEQLNAWTQVLVQDIVVETCIADSETSELPRIAI